MTGKLPVPFWINPATSGSELDTAHVYVVVRPAARLLVQVTAFVAPGQISCCSTVFVIAGVGFTLIVKLVGVPGQFRAVGVTVIVVLTISFDVFKPVKDGRVFVPEGAVSPIPVLEFVQL
jgi:hypothetical protein